MVQKIRQTKLGRKSIKKKVVNKRKEGELSNLITDSIGLNPFKIADPQGVIYGIKNINSTELESGSYENLLVTPRAPERINYWKKIAETIRDENETLQSELGAYKGNFFKEFLSRGDHSEAEKDTGDPMDKTYLEYLEIENRRFEVSSVKEKNVKKTEEIPKRENLKKVLHTELLFETSRDICDETPENTSSEESLAEESDEEILQITNYK